jgi:DNA-binding LytR/AlgR family response regulator
MRRISIAVCDERENKLYTESLCRTVAGQHNIPVSMKTYRDRKELLFALHDDDLRNALDILIIMQDVELGRKIRDLGWRGIMVLSQNTDTGRFQDVFDLNVFNAVKISYEQADMERFERVLVSAAEAVMHSESNHIVLTFAGETRQIDVLNIRYFESFRHIIRVHYDNAYFDFLSSLSLLTERLQGRGFFRTHRSYLVSLGQIRRMTADSVELGDGVTVPISRGNAAALAEALKAWRA